MPGDPGYGCRGCWAPVWPSCSFELNLFEGCAYASVDDDDTDWDDDDDDDWNDDDDDDDWDDDDDGAPVADAAEVAYMVAVLDPAEELPPGSDLDGYVVVTATYLVDGEEFCEDQLQADAIVQGSPANCPHCSGLVRVRPETLTRTAGEQACSLEDVQAWGDVAIQLLVPPPTMPGDLNEVALMDAQDAESLADPLGGEVPVDAQPALYGLLESYDDSLLRQLGQDAVLTFAEGDWYVGIWLEESEVEEATEAWRGRLMFEIGL